MVERSIGLFKIFFTRRQEYEWILKNKMVQVILIYDFVW